MAECRETRSQHQNKKIAFRRLGYKVLMWHRQQEETEKLRNSETVRTYHRVENRVKDHASGFKQTYDEVMEDIGPMIKARAEYLNDVKLGE